MNKEEAEDHRHRLLWATISAIAHKDWEKPRQISIGTTDFRA
jgi:hypothetical protein